MDFLSHPSMAQADRNRADTSMFPEKTIKTRRQEEICPNGNLGVGNASSSDIIMKLSLTMLN